MTASELNRKLLFVGHGDIADFLKESPLNSYLYKRILGILSAGGIEVPILTLFNEIYYQCVRVNYDATPGVDMERRYWLEERNWIRSEDGTQLVFCVVWALLNAKRDITFHEECFLRGMVSFIRSSALRSLSEELPEELLTNQLSVPDRFPVMTRPIQEVDMLWDKSMMSKDLIVNSRRYRELIDSLKRKYHDAWKEITGDYSPSTIEKYVRLYASPEDQLTLVSDMKTGLTEKEAQTSLPYFKELEQRIQTGSFGLSDHQPDPSGIPSDTDTEGDGVSRVHFSLDDAGVDEQLDLARQYLQERNALRLQLEELQASHAMELARMEARYQAEIEKLRQENSRFIRWPSRKRPDALEPSQWSSNVLMFHLDEVADYMKERFSKSGAEEVSAMLYHLAVKHGALGEETLKLIDSIVPAILKRNPLHQIFNLPNVQQFNNNPGEVVNG